MKKVLALKHVKRIKHSFASRHPFVVPIVTFIFLIFVSSVSFLIFGGQSVRPADSKIVRLYIDGESRTIPTRATTIREMLQRSDVVLSENDMVEPSLDSPITADQFSVNVYRARPVTVVDEDGKKVIAKTAETSPATMAKRAGFDLYPEDIINIVEPDKSLRQGVLGTQVTINRAVPIKMNLYGTTYDIRTHSVTVEDLAKERNISFDDKSILPAVKTVLKPNDVVFITQPGKQIVSSEELIPNGEEVINDTGMAVGQSEVRNAGSPGRKAIVYEVAPDGRRIALNEVIITQPVNRVVVKGKKVTAPNTSVAADKAALMAQAGIPASAQSSVDYIISKESGWRPAAANPSGLYVGLGQTSPSKLAAACPNWQTDSVCQLQYFNNYAISRYGSWEKAYAFWTVNRWW